METSNLRQVCTIKKVWWIQLGTLKVHLIAFFSKAFNILQEQISCSKPIVFEIAKTLQRITSTVILCGQKCLTLKLLNIKPNRSEGLMPTHIWLCALVVNPMALCYTIKHRRQWICFYPTVKSKLKWSFERGHSEKVFFFFLCMTWIELPRLDLNVKPNLQKGNIPHE